MWTWLSLDLVLAASAQCSAQCVLATILVIVHLASCVAGVYIFLSLQLKIARLREETQPTQPGSRAGLQQRLCLPGMLMLHCLQPFASGKPREAWSVCAQKT